MIAHQRRIRDQHAARAAKENLFADWWAGLNLDLAKAEVREVSRLTAENIIIPYEWLGTMPAVVWYCYGIFFSGACGGVVVYGPDYAENLHVWDRYGYTDNIILLSRGACVHWTPPNTASALIRRSMKLLPEQYSVVTATVDWAAGEIGTIYQACGFVYADMDHHAKYAIEGSSSRSLRQTQLKNKAEILAAGLEPKLEYQKKRYFAFLGSRAERRALRHAIEHLIRPYPKRAEEVSLGDARQPAEKAGFDSPSPLQHPVQLSFTFR